MPNWLKYVHTVICITDWLSTHKNIYMNVYNSFIQNHSKKKSINISFKKGINKHIVFNNILEFFKIVNDETI